MFTKILATLAVTLALPVFSTPIPATYNFNYRVTNLQNGVTPNEFLVFDPTITSPAAGNQWVMGQTYNATWVTSNIPSELQNATSFILLGHSGNNSENLDIKHPLATGFRLLDGWVNITIPLAVDPRDDYFIVLFGDSGNTSPSFSIVSPSANQ
ncbi:hypothetical protein F5887DRAFT_565197 [Amanita rubescens]|nr:hypothetical protein F5887DRAFT_565197 [Amanita rubescens]